MTKSILVSILFCLMMSSYAQFKSEEIPASMIVALQKTRSDTNRLPILLQLSKYYYFEAGDTRKNLDTAFIYLQQAQSLSEKNHSSKWKNEILCLIGKCYFKIGKLKQANEYFAKIEDNIKKSGNIEDQVVQWEALAWKIRSLDSFGLTKINCFEKIVQLCQLSNNVQRTIEAQKDIADVHIAQGKLDLAQTELEQALAQYKAIGFQKLHHVYILLSAASNYKGNYNMAIDYALLGLESMQKTRDTGTVLHLHVRLAYFYHELGQTEKSIEYFRIVFSREFKNPIHFYLFRDAHFFVRDLIKQKKEKEALAFILDFSKTYPPTEPYGKASLARTLAYCYNAVHDYTQGEKYSQEMIRLSTDMGKNNEIRGEVEYDIGKYYLERMQFQKAVNHFKISLYEASIVSSVTKIKDIHLMLFKVDSSIGNYISAIKHLNQYRQLNDSIFSEIKSKQIEEVTVKYETAKKEKDIQLLNNQNQLQQIKIADANRTRNITLIGTALLVIIVGLLLNRYKLKQRSNSKLQIHQKEIDGKNIFLETLIADQNKLLQEKEWLIKEVHHRVKNNLQMVISLLNTQSAYLDNDAAIMAIQDSQHRMQTMSLIHQKLYQSENVSVIDMPAYINELVSYLKDVFSTGSGIRFEQDIAPVKLDVAQAVPVGLILNEVITNAIKYAFNGNGNGVIAISMHHVHIQHLLLSIRDTGKGLPEDFDLSGNTTLGMSLVLGLVKQLEGSFELVNKEGVEIIIKFPYQTETIS